MASKFQPIDLTQKCRVYFLFTVAEKKLFAFYYDIPNHLPERDIYKEAALHAQTLKNAFGIKKLNRIFIARTQRQIDRVEWIL